MDKKTRLFRYVIMLLIFTISINMYESVHVYSNPPGVLEDDLAPDTQNTAGSAALTSQSTTSRTTDTDTSSDADTDEEDKDKEKRQESITFGGVNRFDGNGRFSSNLNTFLDILVRYSKPLLGFLVFIMIMWTGIFAILKNQNAKERVLVAEKLKHIGIGVLVFSVIFIIVGIAFDFQKTAMDELYGGVATFDELPENTDFVFEGNWLANIFELFCKLVGGILEWIINLLVLVTSAGSSVVDQPGGLEHNFSNSNINDMIFLADLGDTISFETGYLGRSITTAPFTVSQWDRYTLGYYVLSSVFIPLMLIALIKMCYELVIFSGNYEKLAETKQTGLRICVATLIILTGPYIFRLLFTVVNMLVMLVPVSFPVDIFFNSMDQANGLISAATTLMWLFIKFKLCLLFTVRQIMLTVMYIATPIVVGIWAISNKFRAMQLWVGETLSNAATQFCYALVLYIATIVLHRGAGNAVYSLIWFSMMISLGDFFKDSLQGLFQKWGGIDETAVASSTASMVGKWGYGALQSLDSLEKKNINPVSRAFHNALGLGKFITSGDRSGIVSKWEALKAEGIDKRKDSVESFQVYQGYQRSGQLAAAVESSQEAKHLFELWRQYMSMSDLPGEKEKKNAQMQRIQAFHAEHMTKKGVDFVNRAQGVLNSAIEDEQMGTSFILAGKAGIRYKAPFLSMGKQAEKASEKYWVERIQTEEILSSLGAYGTDRKSEIPQITSENIELVQQAAHEYNQSTNNRGRAVDVHQLGTSFFHSGLFSNPAQAESGMNEVRGLQGQYREYVRAEKRQSQIARENQTDDRKEAAITETSQRGGEFVERALRFLETYEIEPTERSGLINDTKKAIERLDVNSTTAERRNVTALRDRLEGIKEGIWDESGNELERRRRQNEA